MGLRNAICCFNSKLVRLEVKASGIDSTMHITFRFQTGSIRSSSDKTEFECLLKCFNSRLVRLKVECGGNASNGGKSKFQFQTGSIRRLVRSTAIAANNASFNSKLVRLEGNQYRGYSAYDCCFNSKLVRLEVEPKKSSLAEK